MWRDDLPSRRDHEYDEGAHVWFSADGGCREGVIDRQPTEREPWYIIYGRGETQGVWCISESSIFNEVSEE